MPLLALLAFDFRAHGESDRELLAAERAAMLSVSMPLLAVSHALWTGVLLLALWRSGALAAAAFLPAAALPLDLALRRTLARPHRPDRAVRWTAVHNALSGALCAAAAGLLARPLPIPAQLALIVAAGATLPLFFMIPGLAMLGCAAALVTGLLLGIAPPLLAVGAALALLLSFLSLLRARDMVARAEARIALEVEAGKARRFVGDFEASGRGWFWETSADGSLTYVSAALARHLGIAATELAGRRFDQLLRGEDEKTEIDAHGTLGFHLAARFPFADLTVRAPGGESWWCLSGTPNFDAYGRFLGFRGMAANLSEQLRSEAEKAKLASTDSLTGLPNRAMMRSMLDDALANAAARRKGCALMLIDLDRFKQVNDRLGHPVGDVLLKQVAERLRFALGDEGQVGRLGGDEFEAILPGAEEEGRLAALAARLIGEISRPYAIEGHQIEIGASIGIAIARPGKAWPEALVKEADLALYAAKADGRGVHHFFRVEMHKEAAERQILTEDLRQALGRGELCLLFQPILATVSEEPVGFEALLRWQHPVRGILPPALVVPLAEEAGLMGRIGDWAIRSACAEAAKWPRHVRVAVNLSAVQLADPALPAILVGALAAAGLDAERLELEISEAAFLADGMTARLAQLRDIGVRLVLDNFGTGRCSLAHLRDAPFDQIKIDRSFLRGAGEPGNRNAAIIRAIVVLAESLGIDTTAQGAETVEEIGLIRRLGCSQVQGFIFARPLPPAEALTLAAESRPSSMVGFGRPPRHRMIRTGILRAGDDSLPVRLRNISEGGAMIECERAFAPDARVTLDLDAAGLVEAEIRWCQRGQVGLKFHGPFQLSALARTNRKAAGTAMLKPNYLQAGPARSEEAVPSRPIQARKRR